MISSLLDPNVRGRNVIVVVVEVGSAEGGIGVIFGIVVVGRRRVDLRVRRVVVVVEDVVVVRISLVVVEEREIVVNGRGHGGALGLGLGLGERGTVRTEDVRGGGRDAEERVGGRFDGT